MFVRYYVESFRVIVDWGFMSLWGVPIQVNRRSSFSADKSRHAEPAAEFFRNDAKYLRCESEFESSVAVEYSLA
jgi:hypothetical protein